MRSFILILVTLAVSSFAQDEENLASLEGMQAWKLFCDTPEKLRLVKRFEEIPGFDMIQTGDGSIDVFVVAQNVEPFRDLLEQNNVRYEVFIENVKEKVLEEHVSQQVERATRKLLHKDSPSDDMTFTYYLNFDEVDLYLERIAARYSSVANLVNLGRSYEGRQMKGLKIAKAGPKKVAIFIDAGIHAREWIAPATALSILAQLVVNKTNEYLLEHVDWYIVPVLNPDGYQFTHSHLMNRLWRKTRSPTDIASCRGVDANRNFGTHWMGPGASSNPCRETYAGPNAFSEVETRNLRDFILAQNGTIKLYLTLHSYGQYILYPWGYTTELPENEPELRALAEACAKAIATVRGTKYTYGTSANHLYLASGGSDDWAMDQGGADLSYTIELPGGSHGFLLPASQIRPVAAETFEAIKVIHSHVKARYVSGL
ncbi:hypothetical protein KM043_011761 [Ampulex compressa]|nr:hypothetical protein KM043_011761 [Ampulex compressa]